MPRPDKAVRASCLSAQAIGGPPEHRPGAMDSPGPRPRAASG